MVKKGIEKYIVPVCTGVGMVSAGLIGVDGMYEISRYLESPVSKEVFSPICRIYGEFLFNEEFSNNVLEKMLIQYVPSASNGFAIGILFTAVSEYFQLNNK